ncbi:MAG TPA: outer membrane beta-barrel protein [Gammaproteobacteria bacterium]|nr:outer membrane beta-barrel protein [Gammaproteobacteria bacterium]
MPLRSKAIRFLAAAVGALLHPLLWAAPAAAEDKDKDPSKLYAGVGLAATDFESDHGGIAYGETVAGLQLYGGFQVRELMGIELAVDRSSGIDSGDILGSGVQRVNISADHTSVIARGVFSLPLEDVLRRHQKITLIGTLGVAHTMDRSVMELTTGTETNVSETDDGVALGAGVIFELKRVRWRATLQSVDREGPSLGSIGVAAEFRF